MCVCVCVYVCVCVCACCRSLVAWLAHLCNVGAMPMQFFLIQDRFYASADGRPVVF